jgi:hypothetical protein
MVRSAGTARASRSMAARAAPPGPHPSRRPARAGLLRMRKSLLNQSKSLCQGTVLVPETSRLTKLPVTNWPSTSPQSPSALNFRQHCLAAQILSSSEGVTSEIGVRRAKAALSSGCKPHPATAPAGSNRSSHGGNEVAEGVKFCPRAGCLSRARPVR